MSNTICIAGAGGVAGVGMTRCLQGHGYNLVGYDSSKWGELAMECNQVDDPYMSDMIIPVPDPLVKKYACGTSRADGGCDLCYLPPKEVVELCQDKAKTAELLGDLAPKTYWVRDTHGAGGSGAQMASEYLPGRNYSVEMVFFNGVPIGHFIKERLAYDIKGSKEPSKQMGSSVVSICIEDQDLLVRAVGAVNKVTGPMSPPHGVFSVDFKENEKGEPKITEINPGRFLTASYPYFLDLDYNLPLLMVRAFFGGPIEGLKTLGKYPVGWGVIRQTDNLPSFFRPDQTVDWK